MARDQIYFGRQVLREALAQKLVVKEIYTEGPGDRNYVEGLLKEFRLTTAILRKGFPKEAPAQHSQGVAFLMPYSFYLNDLPEDIEEKFPRILILNHLQDVQNLGAIARSAAAFQFNLVVHESRRSFQMNAAAVRISQGQAFRLKFWETSNHLGFLKLLEDRGFQTVGLDMNSNHRLFHWKPAARVAVVMGSEESGIQKNLKERLHEIVEIPMAKDVESLNVSHASAVAMSWVFSQHQAK